VSSALEAIETSTTATIRTIAGMASARPASQFELFKPMKVGEDIELRPNTLPDAYPGAVVSMNEDRVEAIEIGDPSMGCAQVVYRVPIFVVLYATSDGTVAGAARRLAWQLSEAIQLRLMVFVPAPLPAYATAMGPLVPGPYVPILADAAMHGVLLEFWAKYMVCTSA
jgi:hypothetical protein